MPVDAQAATPKDPNAYTDPDLRVASEIVMEDTIEAIVPIVPIIIPAVGAALMFMLAFIAIYMA